MGQQTDAAPRVPFRTDEQITCREACRITGLTRKRVVAAARLGLLTTFRPPAAVGGLVRYSRSSAEALAASMVTPATRTTMDEPDAPDHVAATSSGPLARPVPVAPAAEAEAPPAEALNATRPFLAEATGHGA